MADKTLILGAGPAGISAAFKLNEKNREIIVVEKEDQVGGLGKTLKYEKFKTDIGPHRFFSKNRYLYDLIADILGDNWIEVDRLTRFYIGGRFFLYPIQLKSALRKIGVRGSSKIMFDYFSEKFKKVLRTKDPDNFEEYIVSDFGRSLAELNILNYTEKIWGLSCSEISPDWAKQRIKGLSFKEIIKNSLIGSERSPKSLVDSFYYPDEGTGLIYETMKEKIVSKQGENSINFNSFPKKIVHNGEKITKVVLNIGGEKREMKPKYVISSIPITELIKLLKPKATGEVLQAVKNLRFRSHVSLLITINKPSIFPDQWIYFPDKNIPFGRIMEPKNFSEKMSPKDKTSLLLEFFCWYGDEIWKANKNELLKKSLEWLKRLGFVREEDILEYFIHKEKYAYPVYNLDYKKNLSVIRNYLDNFKNLIVIGRSGSFIYNNQDHALEMGLLAARSIIDLRKYDYDEIGSGQEYLEKGFVN